MPPMPSTARPPSPYADAPTLPDGDAVDVASLVAGEWIEIEIGPGRGGFLFERASSAPQAGLIGLEVRRKWATIVDRRLAREGLGGRARVFAEDAKVALRRLRPDASVRRVFLHFPDPWWKKRHQKRLVMEGRVLDEIARLLEAGGELFLQTDVAARADEYQGMLDHDARFVRAGADARLDDNPYEARSPRERRAMVDGLPVYRLLYRRR